ncbi:DNA-directed RNA polymerase subunit alpha [Geodia barretti]|uniref:DNA-directed RNA polymerase n=1 Tax=Geodia barretti TaxID=519541 RepID=A0AA35WA50_GEOBA|nr:DNA-directed RNA polymerase subunit alpha [Geodia barretti]
MTTDPTFVLYDIPEEEEIEIPDPSISVEVDEPEYGKFIIEPLEPGYGVTLGNPMRRVLYNGLDGSAITSVKIEGVQHEYQTIPNVREQVTEILLNVKAVRLRSEVDRPGTLRLEVAGEGQVSAADIMASADFEVVNPELHLATLDSQDARISVELNVERGKGYLEKPEGESQTIGVLPVDAIFSPTRKVNYTVERTRVGQRTNFERLILEVWTDGSLTPVEAVRKASNILVNQFFLFANTEQTAEEGVNGRQSISGIPVERLYLSSRTLNCLKRAGIDRVGEVLQMSREELLKIRNFGEKSYTELYDKLRENDLLPPELDPNLTNAEEQVEEDTAEEQVAQEPA